MPSAILPDGNGGFTPCPELLTEEEAIRFLRLDIDKDTAPATTMKYYRDKGELIAIKVGKMNRYRRKDIEYFLELKSRKKRAASDM